MDSATSLSLKIEQIKTVFQQAKLFAEEHSDLNDVLRYLQNFDAQFSAVAYEGAAMAIALKDLADDNQLEHWNLFLQHTEPHTALQLHIGLGWALSQANKSPIPYLAALAPMMRYRVMDGCGYYDGTMRHRQSIKNQKVPEGLNGIALHAYDQGIGRSIWYVNTGAPVAISAMIEKFPVARQADLWRGAGIACTFVGGTDEKMAQELIAAAKQYSVQLSAGAALAARTVVQSGILNADTERICKVLCNQTATELMQLTERSLISATAENAYADWITAIEKQFISSEVMN